MQKKTLKCFLEKGKRTKLVLQVKKRYTVKNYKAIINFNKDNEDKMYFDRLTTKKFNDIVKDNNYILLSYNSFMGCYIVMDYKLDEEQKKVFNSNPKEYCY